MRFLRAAGHDARMFTHEDIDARPGVEPEIVRSGPNRAATVWTRRLAGWMLRAVEPGTNPYHVADILYSATSARALRRNVAQFDPDVLIVPDRGVPLLWLDPPARCRVIQIEHHNPARFGAAVPGERPPSRRDIELAVWLGQRTLRRVSVVVCPARYMRDEFAKTYAFDGPVEVIPHVVDEQAFADVEPRRVADAPVVYIPSGGSVVKGEPHVLELITRLHAARPELGFFISGALTPRLERGIATAGLTRRVFAPGPLPWRDNLAYAASCRVCVSPTLAENLSMAILEALRVGLPVATFDVGGNRDLVDDTCGALMPLRDVRGLVSATLRLLDDPAMAGRARQRAQSIQERARGGWMRLLGVA
jgi:glycosyltransferase involved in cell wall biosynthesis